MKECVYCKKRSLDGDNTFCQETENGRHVWRVVPFDEQVRTTFIGRFWKPILIGIVLWLLLSLIGIL